MMVGTVAIVILLLLVPLFSGGNTGWTLGSHDTHFVVDGGRHTTALTSDTVLAKTTGGVAGRTGNDGFVQKDVTPTTTNATVITVVVAWDTSTFMTTLTTRQLSIQIIISIRDRLCFQSPGRFLCLIIVVLISTTAIAIAIVTMLYECGHGPHVSWKWNIIIVAVVFVVHVVGRPLVVLQFLLEQFGGRKHQGKPMCMTEILMQIFGLRQI